jgi:hypothetical protein
MHVNTLQIPLTHRKPHLECQIISQCIYYDLPATSWQLKVARQSTSPQYSQERVLKYLQSGVYEA